MPLLLFVVALAVAVAVLAGVAFGATTTSSTVTAGQLGTAAQSESFQVSAADLGEFGGAPPTIKSPAAVVESMGTGVVLYERNAHVRRPMGSTTKIMTAILVLESGLDLNTSATISANAANTWEISPWVKAGSVLTLKQLLYAMLLPSFNGAAVALAEADAGSVPAFIDKMNQKAQELGMTDTHFVTPNGLDDPDHYSTAADMALLARYAMKNARFRQFVDTKTYSLSLPGRSQPLELTNTNKLLQQYDWVTGVKTGVTPNAKDCLVASGTKNGLSVVSVVLGQPDSNVRFSESKALLEYGFTQFRPLTLLDKGVAVAEANVPYQSDGKVELVTDGAVETELHKGDVATTTISVERTLELPIKAGEIYGHVVVTVAGEQVGRVDLVATKSFPAATLGTKLAYLWHRFGKALGIG